MEKIDKVEFRLSCLNKAIEVKKHFDESLNITKIAKEFENYIFDGKIGED